MKFTEGALGGRTGGSTKKSAMLNGLSDSRLPARSTSESFDKVREKVQVARATGSRRVFRPTRENETISGYNACTWPHSIGKCCCALLAINFTRRVSHLPCHTRGPWLIKYYCTKYCTKIHFTIVLRELHLCLNL